MMPGFARARHLEVEKRGKRAFAADCNTFSDINRIFPGGKTGIICSGAVYRYAAQALPDASFLKIGMCYPLPDELIRSFAASVDDLIIAEELEPYYPAACSRLGHPLPRQGVLHPSGRIQRRHDSRSAGPPRA